MNLLVLENDSDIIGKISAIDGDIKLLTDLSSANLADLSNEDIQDMFKVLDQSMSKLTNMKLAIITNSDNYESFKKTIEYTNLASQRPINVMFFNTLEQALKWLGVSNSHFNAVVEKLS